MRNFFIAIPALNSERFIGAALDSVRSQYFGDHQVHLHIQDAGSTDSTMDIVRCFASGVEADRLLRGIRITYISEQDDGMYDAINRAIKNWSSYYWKPGIFFWLNSDDILMPDALTNLSGTFDATATDWIIGTAVDINAKGEIIHNEKHDVIPIDSLREGEFNYTGAKWLRAESTAVRFEAIAGIGGFNKALRLAGDYQFFLELSRKSAPAYVSYPVKAFRRHDSQLSRDAIEYQHERSRTRYFSGCWNKKQRLDAKLPENLEVYYYPDYTSGNSYQKLLYEGIVSRGIPNLEAFNTVCTTASRKLIHIHWLNQIFLQDRVNTIRNAELFEQAVMTARNRGCKIIFTLHNISSHEGFNLDVEERVIAFLFKNADTVHFHHPVVAAEVRKRYRSFPWGKLVVAEIGPYPGRDAGIDDILHAFDMKNEGVGYIAVPGQIRGYKNIEFLLTIVDAFRAMSDRYPGLRILFVGQVHPDAVGEKLEKLRANPIVRFPRRRLDDDEFTTVLSHALFVLLSYKAISTSGSLFHALSAGTPVVAPRLGTIPSYLFDGHNGYLYNAGDEDSCIGAIQKALETSLHNGHDRQTMKSNARASIANLNWRDSLLKILQFTPGD